MYQGSKRKISNKAYAVVKRHWKGKFNRTAYRQEMKKKFKISKRDADILRSDFYNDRFKPLFKTEFKCTGKLTIYCCRDKDDEIVYEPNPKDVEINVEGKARWITKSRFKDIVENQIIPQRAQYEGDIKCAGLGGKSLVFCDYKFERIKYYEKGIPIKIRKRKGK